MLSKLENTRLKEKLGMMTTQMEKMEKETRGDVVEDMAATQKSEKKAAKPDKKLSEFPKERENPYLNSHIDQFVVRDSITLSKSFKAHSLGITRMAMHPKKSILATVSDDRTWKLWNIPEGKYLMGGEGHTDWLSGVEFHPRGNLLATSSADGSAKIWDFGKNGECVNTFKDHIQVVWDAKFNWTGDFLGTCSMDQSIKIWDVEYGVCRLSLRGHVDNVNSLSFIPFSNLVLSCSGDKTISVWDIRTSHCAQTYLGHKSAISRVDCNLQGTKFVSCDMDGVVFLWD